jgi:predicted ATPase
MGAGPASARNARPSVLRPRRLVGREKEIQDVSDMLASAPVTTLVGPGGVGKTALSINVAAACSKDFPDGVTVVWLASVRSAELVAGEIAVQLGLPRLGGQSYEDALTTWLNERDALLVIDNCEHVVLAVADLVDTLTQRLPRLRVLATSREPLWIDGEVTYRLAPLAENAAVELFRERAGARSVEVDTERAAEICRRVDGLPLAIELAAARVAGLDLHDIAKHLDDLFHLLPQSVRRADGVRRSLRATVEWSDALLPAEEGRLLHRMAVFAGPFDLTAVKEVCAEGAQTAAQIAHLTARLVEKSLVLKLGEGRYQLLETIRQYGVEQLGAAGELNGMLARHASFYRGIALQAAAGTMSGPEGLHIDELRRIGENLPVALETLLEIKPVAALEIVASLNMAWWIQGKLREGINWLERGLALAPNAPAELLATARFSQGFLTAHDTDDWHAAAKQVDVGIEVLERTGQPSPILAMLLCLRGECDVFNGNIEDALSRTRKGLAMVMAFDVPALEKGWPRAFCLWNAANAERATGNIEAALSLWDECAVAFVGHGSRIGQMCVWQPLGEIWQARGDLAKSQNYWERALWARRDISASRIGYVHGSMQSSLFALAGVVNAQGDADTASKLLREALPFAENNRDAAMAQQITELLKKTSRAEPTERAVLRPEDGVWRIEWRGQSIHVPDLKGFWHLRELVARPGEQVRALSLLAAPIDEAISIGDAGPQIDREALRHYRARLVELDEELDGAAAQHDVAKYAKRTAERDALVAEIKRATGLGGKPRRAGSPTEKARLNVTRTIRHAINYLSTTAPALAAHFDESLETGVSCCYAPRTNIAWTV